VSDTHTVPSLLVEPILSEMLPSLRCSPALECQLKSPLPCACIRIADKATSSKDKPPVRDAAELLPAVSVDRRLEPAPEAILHETMVSDTQNVAAHDEPPILVLEVKTGANALVMLNNSRWVLIPAFPYGADETPRDSNVTASVREPTAKPMVILTALLLETEAANAHLALVSDSHCVLEDAEKPTWDRTENPFTPRLLPSTTKLDLETFCPTNNLGASDVKTLRTLESCPSIVTTAAPAEDAAATEQERLESDDQTVVWQLDDASLAARCSSDPCRKAFARTGPKLLPKKASLSGAPRKPLCVASP
jgi:hypothetical protein